MMVIFFIGIGTSAVLAGTANTPLQIAVYLTFVGMFSAIYHPVGLAMVVEGREKTGVPLAINGIYGNMGVACAALLTGFLIDVAGWRSAFVIPGLVSIVIGAAYLVFERADRRFRADVPDAATDNGATGPVAIPRRALFLTFAIIFFTTGVGGLVFQSTTFALPKVLDERLSDLAGTATMIGWYTFLVFAIAAFAQLVVGYLVDNTSIRTVFATVAAIQATFLGLMTQVDGISALIVAIAFMLAVFGQVPINDVLTGRMTRSEWRSRVFATRYIVSFSIMASAVPLIAWIHGRWGFNALFGLLAVAAFAIFCAVLFLPRAASLPVSGQSAAPGAV
jgi:MFS family permease